VKDTRGVSSSNVMGSKHW